MNVIWLHVKDRHRKGAGLDMKMMGSVCYLHFVHPDTKLLIYIDFVLYFIMTRY